MPRGRKMTATKASKDGSLRQASLMEFVRPTASTATSAEPGISTSAGLPEPASPDPNTSIIPGTPEASVAPTKGFKSSTGDFVHPPFAARLGPPSSTRLHRKPRRSSLVTQRHILAMAKRVAEGRTDAVSREGDYDGLNYAPIRQVSLGGSSSTTIASQRARKMVQMAVSQASQSKTRQTKQVTSGVVEASKDRSVVFEDGAEAAPQLLKERQPLTLERQELHVLDEVFSDFVASSRSSRGDPEWTARSNEKKETLGKSSVDTVVLGSSLVDALDEEGENGFDNQMELRLRVPPTPEAKKQPWYRCRVTEVATSGHSKIVSTICLDAQASPAVHLSGSWYDTPLQVGDIINLIPSSIGTKSTTSPSFSTWSLSDDPLPSDVTIPPLLVLYPEVLISGTTVAAAATGCARRAVLQHFWDKDEVGLAVMSSDSDFATLTSLSEGGIMLVGSLVHRAFQQAVRQQMSGNPSAPQAVLCHDLITPPTILQLYAMADSAEKFCESLKFFLPKINQWMERHCVVGSNSSCASSGVSNKPVIKEVFDIEENIWCTKFGVKGKIDMTIFCSTNPQAPSFLVPLELKTGKPSFSFEHQGQVLLYLLMLSDRHADRIDNVANYGWLVYLRQMDQSDVSGLVKPQANSFRGLIQTRNHLAASLRNLTSREALVTEGEEAKVWEVSLPHPLDKERICSWCPYLFTCVMLRGSSAPPSSDASMQHLLQSRVKHVGANHKSFLHHWIRLQLLEYTSTNRVDKVLAQIAEAADVEEKENQVNSVSGIRGLVIQDSGKSNCEQEFSICLRRYDNGPISIQSLSVGDFVIVSSDNGRHVGLCLATFTAFSKKLNSLTITTDRPLPSWITRFRLDRYVSDKTTQINLSNLMRLMENSKLCSRLRNLIIDQTCPRFTRSLMKTTLLQIRRFLRPLNICQRCAVLSVLMSKDYTLIEGFPGSGKTETLAVLLRCLTVLGKKTLLISHTHSAVDNVLLRLLKNPEINFVRLGACEKVNPLLHSHSLERQLSEEVSKVPVRKDLIKAATECARLVKFVDEVMTRATIVGCTAIAAGGHEALERCHFDVVVTDEATQLLLPTTLGGLFKLNPDSGQFVLLGDANQLPPLVRSNVAREGGFDTSLFALLSPVVQLSADAQAPEEIDSMGSCLVQLKAQYRMNSQILHLSNTLFYDGRMQCASDEVANRTLKLPKDDDKPKGWLTRVLSTHLTDSVILLDTQDICNLANSSFNTNVNNREIELVQQVFVNFTQRGMEADEIGVIAPYRAQVDALRQRLHGKRSFSDNNGRDVCSSGSVEVSTTDQFQGRDKSIIIVSFVDCLRSQPKHVNNKGRSSTFLLNERPRLNVALTRARQKLILIGCGGTHSRSCIVSQQTPTVLEEMLTVLRQMSAVVPIPSTCV
ncbi:DNA replication ATP-dependent helicase/nuclease DNA2 [Taenia crassiceps]|uniref:DNA replication ATP-dependent helicase/nuclease n=1 Tax=Taenia crassiceps TaxID=6207 RepID=A0ABR4QS02_9CEST